MKTATLNSKGQVTIPAEIRAQLGIVAGDKISFELQGDAALLRVVKAASVQGLRGMFGKAKVSATLEDMARAVRDRAAEQHAKI
jgi:antitoxin PrlF